MTTHNIQPLLNKHYAKAITAKGIYIVDEKGKEYLDGSSGAIACSLGHGHDRILQKIKTQADKLVYVYRSQFASEEAEHLASLLHDKSPGQTFQHSFFVNSGSEAMETAIKIALQYWQEQGFEHKRKFITRRKSYHGITLGALSLSGHPVRRERFEKSLHPPISLASDLEESTLETQMDELKALIEKVGKNQIAALVAEPIVGAAGTALTPLPGYYERIRKICDDYDILFIADEVMTGLGRTGKWFGLEHWSSTADIVTLGKSLGAGYAPIAATCFTQKVMSPIKKGSGLIMSGHTYSGHPLSCAIAAEVVSTIDEDNLVSYVSETGNYLKKRLSSLEKKYHFIRTVRGKGLLLGMEFDPEFESLGGRCVELCFKHGLLVYPSAGGKRGDLENGILIAPPFIITRAQVDEMLQILQSSLDIIQNETT